MFASESTKKHGGTLPPCSRRGRDAIDVVRYSGLLMSDFRRLRSAGTTNSAGSGSARTMLTSRYTVSPVRGLLCLVGTSTFRSGETHSSDTILIGCRLPIAPAGIVVVVSVPVAVRPSIVV